MKENLLQKFRLVKKMTKRGQQGGPFQLMIMAGISVLVLGVVLGVVTLILSTFSEDESFGTIGGGIINDTLEFIANMVSLLPAAGYVMGAVFILGIVALIGVGGVMAYQRYKNQ